MRMAQLADALAHSRSRVTHTITRMERAGLVTRSSSPEDGRGVVASMTDRAGSCWSGWPCPRGRRPGQPRGPGQRRGISGRSAA